MVNIDRVINQSDVLINSNSHTREEIENIAEKVLRRDEYECAVCGNDADQSNIYIKYKESPETFDNSQDALSMENLETVCEVHNSTEDEIAAETEKIGTFFEGTSNTFSLLDKVATKHTPSVIAGKYIESSKSSRLSPKTRLILLILASFILYNIAFYVPFFSQIREFVLYTVPTLFLGLTALLFTIYYVFEHYEPVYEPYSEFDESKYLIGVAGFMIAGGLLGSITLLDTIGVLGSGRAGMFYEGSEKIYPYIYMGGIISQLVGAVLLDRIIQNDKIELINSTVTRIKDQYEQPTVLLSIKEVSENKDHIYGEGMNTVLWRYLVYLPIFMSAMIFMFLRARQYDIVQEMLMSLILIAAPFVAILYLIYRQKLYAGRPDIQ